jgi:cobalt/nickel transport system permease protein
MGGGHPHRSHSQPSSEVGPAIAPEAKIVAALICIGAVVATRREAIWAFIALAGLVIAAAMAVYLPLRILLKRLVIEVPFVGFAVLLPIVGRGERVDVLGVSLSRAGLWGGWNILAKGTLGVAIATVLASTTAVPELLRGFDRLRAPKLFTAIAGFMIRYADVLRGEADRMQVARISRGDNPRFLWQAKALATTAGALFVRSYERGERVHVAMQSRGFRGEMPDLGGRRAGRRDWQQVLFFPIAAAAIAASSWMVS